MAFFRGLSRKTPEVEVASTGSDVAPGAILTEGSLEYTVAQGGNDSLPSYQEASGAPVETKSPLGYFVGPVTIIFLNVSMMIGTGVYSTRDSPFNLDLVVLSWLISLRSCHYPQGNRFCWSGLAVLAPGFSRLRQLHDGVSGVCFLLPKSVWCRSRLPRASISTTYILLPRGICFSVGDFVL